MEPADLVIRRFGSQRKLAAALGHTNHTTVQGWKASGRIPAQQQVAVLDAAARLGIELTAGELVRGEAVNAEVHGNLSHAHSVPRTELASKCVFCSDTTQGQAA
jgi:hypothetical protein